MSVLSDKNKKWLFVSNLLACCLHTALAIVTGVIGNLSLSPAIYNTDIEFIYNSSSSGYELDPFYISYGGFPVTILTMLFFIITASFHLLNVTIFKHVYFDALELCFTPTRWLEYFITATIMSTIIAYLTGVRSVMVIVAVAGLIATTMLFGFMSELYNRPLPSSDEWDRHTLTKRIVPHLLGYIPYLFAWFLILYAFFGTGATCAAPSWVWAIIIGQFVMFTLFIIPQLYQLTHRPSKFVYGEYGFIILSFIAKAYLGINLLAGGLTLDNFDEFAGDVINGSCLVLDVA